jgi:hypothetical protein
MARAKLSEVRNRKPVPCSVCSEVIPVGAQKFVVESFRRRTNFCLKDRPTPERVAAMAPKSRGDRASEAASVWHSTADELESIAVDAREQAEEMRRNAAAEVSSDLKERVEALDVDESVDGLADEMRNWADNMEEHFGSTSKFDAVSEAADTLEGLDFPSIPSFPEAVTPEALEAFASECDDAAGELNDVAEEVEGVSFPGMF